MSRSRWYKHGSQLSRAARDDRDVARTRHRAARLARVEIERGAAEAAQVPDGDYAHHRAQVWAQIEAAQDRRGRKRSYYWRAENRIWRKLRRAVAQLVPWCGAEFSAALVSEITRLRSLLGLSAKIGERRRRMRREVAAQYSADV